MLPHPPREPISLGVSGATGLRCFSASPSPFLGLPPLPAPVHLYHPSRASGGGGWLCLPLRGGEYLSECKNPTICRLILQCLCDLWAHKTLPAPGPTGGGGPCDREALPAAGCRTRPLFFLHQDPDHAKSRRTALGGGGEDPTNVLKTRAFSPFLCLFYARGKIGGAAKHIHTHTQHEACTEREELEQRQLAVFALRQVFFFMTWGEDVFFCCEG